jgi:LemA protein
MIFGVVVLVAFVIGGGCVAMGYQGYNKAIRMDEAVKNRWSEVDNQLQRRFDLIPNLVATVQGTAKQEKDVFLGIANARKAYFQADTVNDKARAAGQVESALSRLLLLKETYPELKSNTAFLKLQDQLEGTENRLTVARQNYNAAVQDLNTFIRPFPGRLYASFAGVKEAEYFKIDQAARETPKVDFSDKTAPEKSNTGSSDKNK